MNAHKLAWGILGAARINERLLPAILHSDNAELIALASRRPGASAETLAKYAPCYPQIAALNDLDTLLEQANIQAVYIPMANREHTAWTLKALAAGKHVLCEKPMALTVNDIDTIAEQAQRQNLTVMEGFMYRFHPQHARVLEIIQSGAIGEIRSARATFSFMMRPARMYRLEENITHGGGAMWDIGCYAIHALRMFFAQRPNAVTCMSHHVASGADIASSGVLDYGDGRFAQFDFSFSRARRCEYEIIGTHGGIKCHTVWQLPGDVPVISWWNEDGQQHEQRLAASNHFELEIAHFSDCVLNQRPVALTLTDARDNCLVINAALQSAREGRTIKL